ncbi:MAG: SMC-Scp complex subunit ScpB [Micavibrio sp.]|nr:SMC-Scp complex subunit ScpB [Micavibrio sp.]
MINPDHIRIVEALLFASADPLTAQELHERTPQGVDVGACLLELQDHYKLRGVNLNNIDGRWAFRTALDLADALTTEKEVQKKLSRAALETLSIIAYHQPVTRAEIENIRGVATNRGTLDVLVEAGWVKPGRRRETLGRPLTWVTTGSFLDHFALESLMELPGLDELKASGMLDRRPAIDAIPGQQDLFGGGEAGQIETEGVEETEEGTHADDDLDSAYEEDLEE